MFRLTQSTSTVSASPGGLTTGLPQHKTPSFLRSGAVLGDRRLPEEPAAGTRLGDLRPTFGASDGRLADAAAGLYSGPFRPNLEGGSGGHGSTTAAFTRPAPLEQSSPRYLVMIVLLLATISVLGYMAPGADKTRPSTSTGPDMFYFRIPPCWSPDHESTYSFGAYMTDITVWTMLTDLSVSQQCIAIIMRLGGAARQVLRMLTPQELTTGEIVNGVAVDPVTYLHVSLHSIYADIEGESRLGSIADLLTFTRLPGENMNALLTRYDAARQRAATE